MEIVAMYSGVQEYSDDRPDNPWGVEMSWEAGRVYELNKCPACDLVTLRSYLWHSGSMDGSDIEYVVLYPSQDKLLRGLPKKIDQDYRAAQKVRNISANATAFWLVAYSIQFVKIGAPPAKRWMKG